MAWMVLLMTVLTLLPFLGLNEFSTKGEPREAVVAMSMLQQHNWILPENNGFLPLVYRSTVDIARLCKRIYLASALCRGTDCVAGEQFLLLCPS